MRNPVSAFREKGRLRLYVLNTHPIQYYAPLWRELSHLRGIRVEVLYGSDFSVRGYRDREFGKKFRWDINLTAGYPSSFLGGGDRVQGVSFWTPKPGPVFTALAERPPGVVLLTAYQASFWLAAILAAKLHGHRLVIRHDIGERSSRMTGAALALRKILLRILYRGFDAFAVVGRDARAHLAACGVPENKMVASPFCVDSNLLETQIRQGSRLRNGTRKKLGIAPGDLAILFCGKLIPKKDPLLIPQALGLLPESSRKRIHLLVAGDGQLSRKLAQSARPLLGRRYHALGFLNQSRMPTAYAPADLLILPSQRHSGESWGLVVNEALQWGIPALVSDGVGCGPDLIVPGKTGSVFSAGRADLLAEAIRDWERRLPKQRARVLPACRRHIRGHSLGKAAEGIRRAAQLAAA